jgi:hypothetical protein
MAAAKPITCYSVFTAVLYSLTQILNTQFQHPIIYIQFVVHPFEGVYTNLTRKFCLTIWLNRIVPH